MFLKSKTFETGKNGANWLGDPHLFFIMCVLASRLGIVSTLQHSFCKGTVSVAVYGYITKTRHLTRSPYTVM